MFKIGDRVIYFNPMDGETLLCKDQIYTVVEIDYESNSPYSVSDNQRQLGVRTSTFSDLVLRFAFRFKLSVKEEREKKLKKINDRLRESIETG